MKVAAPSPHPCLICALPPAQRATVNGAIWDGTTERVPNYRIAGQRAARLAGLELEVKTVTNHAEHVERSWRDASPQDPARGKEAPVFPTDYESLVDKAAHVGAVALGMLERRIQTGELGDRELLGAAKMGVVARTQQEAVRAASKRPQINVMAIFGIAGGHFAELPEAEAVEIIDMEVLRDEVAQERAALRLAANSGRSSPG